MNKTTYADLLGRPKLRNVMKQYEESRLQQQCVSWFRGEYPEYAMLLTHPINEGNKDTRKQGAIHKKEGTVAGVPDLLFFLPCFIDGQQYHGLGIEFKTPKGSQSQQQKDFQKMFEAAGYRYIVVRDFETFKVFIELWIACASEAVCDRIKERLRKIEQENEDREREKFYKVIGKKK